MFGEPDGECQRYARLNIYVQFNPIAELFEALDPTLAKVWACSVSCCRLTAAEYILSNVGESDGEFGPLRPSNGSSFPLWVVLLSNSCGMF
jgi:hypothetical protein